MSTPSATGDDASGPAAVLQSMTLLATLSTAADVCTAVADRRAGRDPSAQEAAQVAAPRLRLDAQEAQDLLMQLMLSHVNVRHAEEAELATIVRHFDERIKLQRVERLLQRIHQRLLSLYPDVSEALVEEARVVHRAAEALLDVNAEAFIERLGTFLEQGLGLAAWVRHEVAA